MKRHRSPPLWSLSVPAVLCSPLWAQQPVAQEPAATPPEQPVLLAPLPPGKGMQWKFGDTTLKLGGYVKVDAIHDFDQIGSTDSFDPRTIPTDGSEGTNTRLHARQTRLNLDLRTPSSAGDMKVYVEGDFFGSGNSFRLRHAYGTIGPVLAGQTWSTFMDDEMPETLDFESPIGFPQIRQTMIRFTANLEEGTYLAFALEDPDSDVIAPAVPGEVDEPLPDINARFHWEYGRGHVHFGTFLGMASYQPTAGSSDDVTLWGLNLSVKHYTWDKDNVYAQLTYGDGVGRYRGGTTAAPDASGDLEAITTTAVCVGYQHYWSDAYRSTLTYSWAEGDIPAGAPPATSTEEVDYLAANLIWQFADRAWTGIEYLYGSRDTLDGEDGDANRIQLSVRFDL